MALKKQPTIRDYQYALKRKAITQSMFGQITLARPDGMPLVRIHKQGRNEPCYCGSGKKYKTCHLPIDHANLLKDTSKEIKS